jgi:signal transduction histidine kinase
MNTLWRAVWHTLWFRLTAAFLLVALVGVFLVAVSANRATTAGFRSYLHEAQWADLRTDLGNLYARQGNWQGAELLLVANRPGQGGTGLLLLDEQGLPVAAGGGRGNRPGNAAEADVVLPIWVDGRPVGSLLIKFPVGAGAYAAENFLREVNQALWLGGGLAALLALALGILLAWGLTRPLTQLTQATRQMAAGNLNQQVPPARGELGELAAGFNQMATALAEAEQHRQQLLADVAHELRTPLSIMRGHLEAMLDGVFVLSLDNLAVVHEESLLLGRLIEDLRTLSLVESGNLPLNLRRTDLAAAARHAAAAFAPLAEAETVQLIVDLPAAGPLVIADPDRLQQVLSNLLANGLRHVRQNGSLAPTLQITVTTADGRGCLAVADNGPGLSPAARQRVFDRFWRAENSRSRDQGGSGLGLAICRAIVEAHHGRIWVEETPGGGATFILELPVETQIVPVR